MQASNAQPQTPMLSAPKSSMDGALQKLIRNQELSRLSSGKEFGSLQRLSIDVEQLGNSMKIMQDEFRRDIKDRRKFFTDQAKLRKEEEKNLTEIKTAALFNLRSAIAAGSGLLALKEFSDGDIGGALQATGVGLASLAPEITDLVISILAAKGLMGAGRGLGVAQNLGGAGGFLRNIGGKKGLFLISALAASILGSTLFGGGGNDADRRRIDATRKTESGANMMNDSDVDRFRKQLNRFERILDNMQGRKRTDGSVDPAQAQAQFTDTIGGEGKNEDFDNLIRGTKDLERIGESNETNDGQGEQEITGALNDTNPEIDLEGFEPGAVTPLSDREANEQILAENAMFENFGNFSNLTGGSFEDPEMTSLTRMFGNAMTLGSADDGDIGGSGEFDVKGLFKADGKDSEQLLNDILDGKELNLNALSRKDDGFIGPKWLGIKNPFNRKNKNEENRNKIDANERTKATDTNVEVADVSSPTQRSSSRDSSVVDSQVRVDSNFKSETGACFDKLDCKGSYRSYSVFDTF